MSLAEVLGKASVASLRKMASGLVERYTDLSKDELVAALATALTPAVAKEPSPGGERITMVGVLRNPEGPGCLLVSGQVDPNTVTDATVSPPAAKATALAKAERALWDSLRVPR